MALSIPTLAMTLAFMAEPLLSCLHVVSFSVAWAACRMFNLFFEDGSTNQMTRGWAGDTSCADIANMMILLGVWLFVDIMLFSLIKMGV